MKFFTDLGYVIKRVLLHPSSVNSLFRCSLNLIKAIIIIQGIICMRILLKPTLFSLCNVSSVDFFELTFLATSLSRSYPFFNIAT
jgi:hypothetical protein